MPWNGRLMRMPPNLCSAWPTAVRTSLVARHFAFAMQPRKIPVIRENAGACASWRICFLCGNYLTSGFGSLGLHLSCGLPDQKFLHQMTGLKGGGERTVLGAAARSGFSRRQTVLRLDGSLGLGCLLRHGLGFGSSRGWAGTLRHLSFIAPWCWDRTFGSQARRSRTPDEFGPENVSALEIFSAQL